MGRGAASPFLRWGSREAAGGCGALQEKEGK